MNFLSKLGVGSGSQARQDEAESVSLLSDWKDYNGSGRDVEAGTASGSSSQALLQSVDKARSKVSELFSSSVAAVSKGVASGVAALPTADSLSIPSAQQLTFFFCFLAAGAVFLILAFTLFLPILAVAPAKFALAFTLGSICTMLAFGALRGWKAQMSHMLSMDRLPFTAAYIGSILATLFSALVLQSYILSLVSSGAQLVALLYYTMSYFPGGTQGAKFMVSAVGSAIASCFGRLFK